MCVYHVPHKLDSTLLFRELCKLPVNSLCGDLCGGDGGGDRGGELGFRTMTRGGIGGMFKPRTLSGDMGGMGEMGDTGDTGDTGIVGDKSRMVKSLERVLCDDTVPEVYGLRATGETLGEYLREGLRKFAARCNTVGED